jgi:hypothetical protein
MTLNKEPSMNRIFNMFMLKETIKSWYYIIPASLFSTLCLWSKGFTFEGILFCVITFIVWLIPVFLTLSTAMLNVIDEERVKNK